MRARDLQPELMDDPALPADEHRAALAQLARLNRVSRTAESLWPWIRSVQHAAGPASLLDVATGSGDVPSALAGLAARHHLPLSIHACDASPIAASAARARWAAAHVDATIEVRDVVRHGLSQPDASIDVVTCSLFLHHLKEGDAIAVLREMARVARALVLVSDLRRCHSGLAAAWMATRLATTSRVVRVDSIRSVRAAFTPEELESLSNRAGMSEARILRRWPFRMLLVWRRPRESTALFPATAAAPGTLS